MIERRWAQVSGILLGALMVFAVGAFGCTGRRELTALQLGIFAMAAAWTVRQIFRPDRLQGSILLAPLAAVLLCGVWQIASGASSYPFETWNAVLNWGAYGVLFVVCLNVFSDSRVRSQFLRYVLYGGCVFCVLAVLQHFATPEKIYGIFPIKAGVPFGPFVNRDHYAAFAELLLPMAVFEVFRDRRRAVRHAALAGVIFASVILCASRAGAILVSLEVLAVLGVAAMHKLVSRVDFARLAGSLLLVIALLTAVVGWDILWDRRHDPDPFRYRREMAASAIEMARQRPWTGFGLGAFETVYPAYASFDLGLVVDHAHNDWAEWLAEGGLVLFLSILSLALLSAGPAIRSGWALGIPVVFLHSLVDFPLQVPGVASLVFVLLAALQEDFRCRMSDFGCRRERRKP
jgi:O-antigen ligase